MTDDGGTFVEKKDSSFARMLSEEVSEETLDDDARTALPVAFTTPLDGWELVASLTTSERFACLVCIVA